MAVAPLNKVTPWLAVLSVGVSTAPNSMRWSSTVMVVELIVVVPPDTSNVPLINTLPAAVSVFPFAPMDVTLGSVVGKSPSTIVPNSTAVPLVPLPLLT